MLAQGLMHFAHEGVEMDAALALVGHGGEKAIHQEAFAAPYPAPEPDTPWQFGMHQQFAKAAAPCCLECDQVIVELLQAHRRDQLRRIGDDAARGQRSIEAFDHAVLGDVEYFVRHQEKGRPGKPARPVTGLR
jgi:hypothetical protein